MGETFDGPATGDHAVGTSYPYVGGDEESEAGVSVVSAVYLSSTLPYFALAGTISPTVDPVGGSVNLQLGGLSFEGYDGEGVTHEGAVVLNLLASCQTVYVEASGTCVWASEAIPFTSAFCTETMATYSEDVWWGPPQDASQD